jgi:hypothetical protein
MWFGTTLRRVTNQKTEEFISTAAEAFDDAQSLRTGFIRYIK